MGKTYQPIIDLLRAEVPEKCSRNEFCRRTKINQNSFDRYIAGISEPTKATLDKLSEYFKEPVWKLRGENPPEDKNLWNLVSLTGDLFKEFIKVGIPGTPASKMAVLMTAEKFIAESSEKKELDARQVEFVKVAQELIDKYYSEVVKEMKALRETGRPPGIVPRKKKSDK